MLTLSRSNRADRLAGLDAGPAMTSSGRRKPLPGERSGLPRNLTIQDGYAPGPRIVLFLATLALALLLVV